MKLVLLGPPGAGKGTLAAILKNNAGIAHFSTGDMFREEMKQGTTLGQEAKRYIDKGELVPDDLVIKLLENKIGNNPSLSNGFMLDGFPRSLTQAKELDRFLASIDQPLDFAVYMETKLDKIITRLAGRRICQDCGAVYHISNRPPKVSGVCDACGGKDLYQRKDDNEATIRTRMDVYLKTTLPIVDYYKVRGILLNVDGAAESEDLEQIVLKKYNEGAKQHKH